MSKPHATSTPTSVPHVSGRKGIKESNSFQSPIDLDSPRHHYDTRSYRKSHKTFHENECHSANKNDENECQSSPDDKELTDEEVLPEEVHKSQILQAQENPSNLRLYLFIGFILSLGTALYFSSFQSDPQPFNDEFNRLAIEFSTQQEDFWLNIKVAIQDVQKYQKPRTIMLLYDSKATHTLNKILDQSSKIALRHLDYNNNKVIEIDGGSLNTSELIKNYGKLVDEYSDKLKKNGVMIVRNIEKIPGTVAQVFHTFCDDLNPVVERAVFFLTLKEENLPNMHLSEFVEGILLKMWNDIGKDDKFYPLFTRISSTILVVKPE